MGTEYSTYSLDLIRSRVFPLFCLEEHPRLVDFVACYLEWMEEKGNAYYDIMNLQNYTDVDSSVDAFMEYLKNKFTVNFPKEYAGDTKLFLRNAIYLYSCKGTEESYRLFFRMMYNTFVEFYYPKKDMLRLSDGKWNQFDFIYTHLLTLEQLNSLIGCTLKGQTSGATAYVTNISSQVIEGGETHPIIVLSNIQGKFLDKEYVFVSGNPETEVTQFQIDYVSRLSGYWSNSDGMLSSEKVIQDSYYYQDFSYELRTDVTRQLFVDIIKKIIHPAGLRMFNSYLSVDEDNVLKFPTKLSIVFLLWILTRTYEFEQDIELLWHIFILLREKFPFVIRRDLESYLLHDDILVNFFEDVPVFEVDLLRSETNMLVFDHEGNFKNAAVDFWNFTISEREHESHSVIRLLPKSLYWKTTENPYVVPKEYNLDKRNYLAFSGEVTIPRSRVAIDEEERTFSVAGIDAGTPLTVFWWSDQTITRYYEGVLSSLEMSPMLLPFSIATLNDTFLMIFCDGRFANPKFDVFWNRIVCKDESLLGKRLEIYFIIPRDMTFHDAIYFDENIGFKELPKVHYLPNGKYIPSGWLEEFSRDLPMVQEHHLDTWIPRLVVETYADVVPYEFFDADRLASKVMVFNSEYGNLINEDIDFSNNTSKVGRLGKYYSVFFENVDTYYEGKVEGYTIILPKFKNVSKNFFLFIHGRKISEDDYSFIQKERMIILKKPVYGYYSIFFFHPSYVRERKKVYIDDFRTELPFRPDEHATLIFCDGYMVNMHFFFSGKTVYHYNSDFFGKTLEFYILNPNGFMFQDTRPTSEHIGFIYGRSYRLPLKESLLEKGKTESVYNTLLSELPFKTDYTLESLIQKDKVMVSELQHSTASIGDTQKFEGSVLTFDSVGGEFLNPYIDYVQLRVSRETSRIFNVLLETSEYAKEEFPEEYDPNRMFLFDTNGRHVPFWEFGEIEKENLSYVYSLNPGIIESRKQLRVPENYIINKTDVGVPYFDGTSLLFFCDGKLMNIYFTVMGDKILCNKRDMKGKTIELVFLSPNGYKMEDLEIEGNKLNSKLFENFRGFSSIEIINRKETNGGDS